MSDSHPANNTDQTHEFHDHPHCDVFSPTPDPETSGSEGLDVDTTGTVNTNNSIDGTADESSMNYARLVARNAWRQEHFGTIGYYQQYRLVGLKPLPHDPPMTLPDLAKMTTNDCHGYVAQVINLLESEAKDADAHNSVDSIQGHGSTLWTLLHTGDHGALQVHSMSGEDGVNLFFDSSARICFKTTV